MSVNPWTVDVKLGPDAKVIRVGWLAWCLNSVLNLKALVGAFNQEKALVGAFSVIVKTSCGTDGSFTQL